MLLMNKDVHIGGEIRNSSLRIRIQVQLNVVIWVLLLEISWGLKETLFQLEISCEFS